MSTSSSYAQADELLAAADKYQLERLKANIERSLLRQLHSFAGHVRAGALYWLVSGERMRRAHSRRHALCRATEGARC